MSRYFLRLVVFFILILPLAGCQSTTGNVGNVQSFPVLPVEPDWIRNGEPVLYEAESWFPADDVESLLDSEVLLLGDYRGTQIFADKVDVRPYERIYTKFGRNKFRYFTKKDIP